MESNASRVVSKPELGLYDTRVWDSHYIKYIQKKGPNPGRHPDPECIWNSDENSFNFEDYKNLQHAKRDEARKNGLL